MGLIPILVVCYDPEKDELFYRVNEQCIDIYKRRYGLIGQQLESLSKHIQRKEWPHFLSDKKFKHFVPEGDIITHDTSGYICSCSPQVNVLTKEVHHIAMDPGIASFKQNPSVWRIYY